MTETATRLGMGVVGPEREWEREAERYTFEIEARLEQVNERQAIAEQFEAIDKAVARLASRDYDELGACALSDLADIQKRCRLAIRGLIQGGA